jgi:NitT/TauT family transport system substrate-binding protein
MEDPEEGFEISKKFVDGLDQADQTLMLSVLEESVRFWEAERLGVSEEEAWRNMHDLLLEMGLLPEPTDIEQAFSNEFVP